MAPDEVSPDAHVDAFVPPPKQVRDLFFDDPDVMEVTVKWRDGSGGAYSRMEGL